MSIFCRGSHSSLRIDRVAPLAFVLCAASPALAQNLTGTWEVQSMGSDRIIQLEQKGNKLVAHRVMWPEFEGEKYKLEHLYRGVIKGNDVSGQLLVKEEELPKFEVLRDFSGSIKNNDLLVLDGLPMKRTGGPASGGPAAAPTNDAVRPLDGPGMSQAAPPPKPSVADSTHSSARPSDPPTLAQAQAPPKPPAVAMAPAPAPAPPAASAPPPAAAAPTAPPAEEDPGTQLFANIMGTPGMEGLFRVSMEVNIPDESAEQIAAADALYKKKKYQAALALYAEANEVNTTNATLLHRMGRCHLKLKQKSEARALLRRALRLDPNNKEIKKDYAASKGGK